MNTITETIASLGTSAVITQGEYPLTSQAMLLRNQRPLHCGDDYKFEFTVVDEDGDARVITGATIRFTVKLKKSDADPGIVQKTATIVDGAAGRFDVELVATDVIGPEAQRAYYDIQMTSSGGDTETLIYGDIEFLQDVTTTTP